MIVAKLNEATAETGKAAQLCDALSEGGYNDWFMPSALELEKVCENLYVNGIGGFSDSYYWSSSEYGGTAAYVYIFDTDAWDREYFETVKTNDYDVLAIRSF